MPRLSFSQYGTTPFQRLLGHNPIIQNHWVELEAAVFAPSSLSEELKEQVRRTLAFGNGCEYCMAKGRPDTNPENERISLAVAFAQMVVDNHRSIEDSAFQVLRSEFTEQEISELCALICFINASQTFGALLQLHPGDAE
jgi:alkylhydroperoxidase family enzyme